MQDAMKKIFSEAVASVEPRNLIKQLVRVQDGNLLIKDRRYSLKSCYMVGFGKAVLGMAVELEGILGENLKHGIVNVPSGIFECFANRPHMLPTSNSKIRFVEGAENNMPDENAHRGASAIKELASNMTENDLLIVLISGGGSALLPSPKHPIGLHEKLDLVKNLSRGGADIFELNCVRRKISDLKAGGLAKFAKPGRIVCFILSDVVGDSFEVIASGPTVPNSDSDEHALDVVKKYNLFEALPTSIVEVLKEKCEASDGNFEHVDNFLIGNNKIAALAAKRQAETLGYQSFVLSTRISGNVVDVAKNYAKLVHLIVTRDAEGLKCFVHDVPEFDDLPDFDFEKPICVICAGEPTVVVTGNGKGGRNQELALRFSLEVSELDQKGKSISFLSAGTDGIDGPTDACGAIGNTNLFKDALSQNIDPIKYLNDNDSYGFYSEYYEGRDLIKIGHTGTNVMDLNVIIIESTNP